MKFLKPNESYWNNKMIAYFHDPIDKVFDIQGHEKRGEETLKCFGLQKPNNEFWKTADGIASGFERGQVPSYVSKDNKEDSTRSGMIDFKISPTITHPTTEGSANIQFDLSKVNKEYIFKEVIKSLTTQIGATPETCGFSNKDQFKNNPEAFAYSRFLYSHLALRFKLAENNVAGLGALWHRLPADTRFPDHTIWQHNGLVSALSSCIELGDKENIAMMVVSITPVQGFIAKARKLRDYWTGSVILSWLAFEGIRWVIENLGCDHILYPSLIDQPLVNEYLKTQGINEVNFLNKESEIASFPNKFLFLMPYNRSDDIAGEIKNAIIEKWGHLKDSMIKEYFDKDISDEEKKMIGALFQKQFNNYWDITWASVKLLDKNYEDKIKELLPPKSYENNFKLLNIFNKIIEDKQHYEKSGLGILYSTTHSLVQTALASQKTQKKIVREEENGQKCQICGEFEVLNTFEHKDGLKAKEYKKNIDDFWNNISKKIGKNEIKPNEKLCSICFTKRIAYRIFKDDDKHILNKTFKNCEKFPTTTEVALYDDFDFQKAEDKYNYAQGIHEKEDIQVDNRNRYYAILMMDGDKMGALVNGETIGSTWESIMHPDIVKRLSSQNYDKKYKDNWDNIYKNHPKRLLTPSIHLSISESLGDFAIYGVSRIIKKYSGKLIYAGGDDVCAVLPVSNVIQAADEIRKYYNSTFKVIMPENNNEKSENIEISDVAKDNILNIKGKLSVGLGKADKISISAGILICHHKESLTAMLEESHRLLDKSKTEGDRNAVAVELRKRSGGARYFVSKWEDDNKRFEIFKDIGGKIGDKSIQEVSRSLVYRLNAFQDGFEAMLNQPNKVDLVTKFVAKQLDRSGVGNKSKEEKEQIASDIAKLGIIKIKDESGKEKEMFNPETLIIAGFIADKGGK